MPLYKVAETINPEQGMYDYVIIDEASQLGGEYAQRGPLIPR
jgi:hypothetical protein